jgi:hypothetical protein
VTDSVIANNGNDAIFVQSQTGNAANTVMVRNSTVANNLGGHGLYAEGAPATILVTQSAITGNQIGWTNNGGTLLSYGDNKIYGNTFNYGPPPTTPNE